jgi:hypothetical protein
MIRPGGLLLVIPPRICCPGFSFIIGGVAKEYITKLGCEKYFARGLHTEYCWRWSYCIRFSPPKSQVWLRELFTGYLLTPRGTWTIRFDLACIKIFDFTLVGLGFLGVALVPFYIGCDFFWCVIDLRKVYTLKYVATWWALGLPNLLRNKSKVWMKEALKKNKETRLIAFLSHRLVLRGVLIRVLDLLLFVPSLLLIAYYSLDQIL